jgi:hypothetical protein
MESATSMERGGRDSGDDGGLDILSEESEL